MSNNNVSDAMMMPEFTIDTTYDDKGKVASYGIKRMYDIALALNDSIMVWGAPGCLAGDTLVRGHWDGKADARNGGTRGVKIKNIFAHQHGQKYPGSHQIKSTDFIVKSYNESTGLIEDTKVTSTYSGKKQCYLIKTNTKQVEVTEEHPFLTDKGWVNCSDLKVGDIVYVHSNSSSLIRTKVSSTKKYENSVSLKYHPNASTKNVNGYTYFIKKRYVLEYEAARNNMSYKEYVDALNKETKGLYYVPEGMEVHHINRDRSDNSLANIELLSTSDHAKLHAQEDNIVNSSKLVAEKIISIEPTEVKDTYDLTCEENHNFFANDILVHNCGKSQAVQQWNRDKVEEYKKRIAAGENVKPWNPVVCDVRLSMKEPVDLVGVPFPVKNADGTTQTYWAVPSMWPKDDKQYSGGVILLDEINQGQAAILNAAFQLIQDKALGEYKVPEGYIIIACANPSAYNNTVTEFSVPLSNRFSHFNVRPDFKTWFDYRMENGGCPEIMTFLMSQGQDLLFDKVGMENKVGSLKDAMYTDIAITPRSWEVIEKLYQLPEGTKETGGFTLEEKQRYATGRLGLALATKVFKFLKESSKYQDWREVLQKGKPFKSEEQEEFWNVQINCIQAISNEPDDTKCREYVMNFLEATRKLTKVQFKVVNIAKLTKLKRLHKKIKVFNALVDAKDLVELCNLGNKN